MQSLPRAALQEGRAPGSRYSRLQRFFDEDLWVDDARRLGWLHDLVVGVCRAILVAFQASRDSLLTLHAMGLVYSTLLSLVPFLAVAFSVLKAFGARGDLAPVVTRILEPLGPRGAEMTERLLEFVSRMNVGVLGAIGVAGLFYTVLSLIEKIEDALNHIWNVRASRGLRRKFTDYLSVLLVGPVLVFAAFGIIASLRSSWLVQRLLQVTRLETPTVFLAGHLTPFLLLVAAFTFLYRFLPYTRVRLGAALVGGITAAIVWELSGIGFALLVAGSTSYAAIYSSFAVLVLSLIWLQIAWLVVLIGGQVAYAHQHPSSYAAARRPHGLRFRERVGLAALTEIARRHLSRQSPEGVDELSRAIGVPTKVLDELADVFVRRGILARTVPSEALILARPPEDLPIVEILDTIHDPARMNAGMPESPGVISGLLERRDEAVRQALSGLTLRSLVSQPASSELEDLGARARYRTG